MVWLVLLMVIVVRRGEGKLVQNFYGSSCSNVEQIVRQAVQNKLSQTLITIPATLRLFFHDCFVEVYPPYLLINYIFKFDLDVILTI